LSGAVSLFYLGQWLGISKIDPLARYAAVGGPVALLCAGIVQVVVALLAPESWDRPLTIANASLSAVAAALSIGVCVRAMRLGDALGRAMLIGCSFLAMAVIGLLLIRLFPHEFSLFGKTLIAFFAVAFYLVVIASVILRNRQLRRIKRMAGLSQGVDAATGLPHGSVLLAKVDDALWRSARMGGKSAVICLYLRNLYELADAAGHGADHQIQRLMTARIRRAVGFRSVVGLYHPRCFVIVISGLRNTDVVERFLERLRYLACKPMSIPGLDDAYHQFTPKFSIGHVLVSADSMEPAAALDEAERNALAAQTQSPSRAHVQAVA
jgi:GGDEF domain-containing protein